MKNLFRGKHGLIAIALSVCLCVTGFIASPVTAWAATVTPKYDWYTADPSATEFIISDTRSFAGLAELVNGAADPDNDGTPGPAITFSGKTVKLDVDLNFSGSDIVPIGGTGETSFDGVFDGQGHSIDNFLIDPRGRTSNIGVFGRAGTGSQIKNLTIDSYASLTISTDSAQISYVGMIVGESRGDMINNENSGSLTITNNMNQTKTVKFPIKNVGGLAGSCLGDITDCVNNGTISVTEGGIPLQDAADPDWKEQYALVINVGGVVGLAGSPDGSIIGREEAAENAHGTITNCSNTGDMTIDTPNESGFDRFGNPVFAQSTNVGGVAGYSRGSLDRCRNSAYLKAEHSTSFGGVVGSVRAKTSGSGYSGNFTSEDTDDGMAFKNQLTVTNCLNSGIVYGHAFSAGIAGRTGTYVDIRACLNARDAIVVGTRVTKPFPSGIVGGTYGTVSYCANLGQVVSGKWNNESRRTVAAGGGYYAAGIAGNTVYFTKSEDGAQVRVSPMPEVYACYNGGPIIAKDDMRQRNIVGDNSGYVHDNLGVRGLCAGDKMVYGDTPATDTESSGGVIYNNRIVTQETLRNNSGFEDENGASTTPILFLNYFGDKDGWETYWVKSNGVINAGYPALSNQITDTWTITDISNATVEWAGNAEYTGLAAIPKARVTAANGAELVQGVDFRLIPQTGATEITPGTKPYTGTVVGIGIYSGQAAQTLNYGIDKGNMKNCTALVDTKQFNWEAQPPTADMVHVTNMAGLTVDPAEYSFALDPQDRNLTEGQPVNAKGYKVIVAAKPESPHFTGEATAVYHIKQAKIVNDKDEGRRKENAYVETISYLGQEYSWQSLSIEPNIADGDLTAVLEYTGHPIRPEVTGVVYLDRPLTEGSDFRLLYGDGSLLDGGSSAEGKENLGKAGGADYGYITVRYVPGSNFSNYDNMKILIKDTAAKNDISKAVLKDGKGVLIDPSYGIVYEEGSSYKPVHVWFGGSELTEGDDYTVSYTGNDKPGEAQFTITGAGANFEGSLSGSFTIAGGLVSEFTFDNYDPAAKTVTVTGVKYLGSNPAFDMVIPGNTTKDGATYAVTAIGAKAFGGSQASDFTGSDTNLSKSKIRSVLIPPGVQKIGDYAFAATSNTAWNQIANVTFADPGNSQLTAIGNRAFMGCGNLTEFTFPAKVATIDTGAFYLGNATVPAKLHTLNFLTKDPALPTSVSATLTFSGVGFDGKEVRVNGYNEAVAVKELAARNAANTNGANAGRNFKFYIFENQTNPQPKPATPTPPPVTPEPKPEPPVTAKENVTKITSPLKNVYIQSGKSYIIPYAVYDGNTVIKPKLTWKSSKPKIAKVSATGKVTIPKAVKKGKATITATAANGKKLTITVNVSSKAVKLKKFTVKAPAAMKAKATKVMILKLAQPKATLTGLTFKSSNAKGLSVDKAGKLTAIKKGKYTITIKVGGLTVKKKITVK